MKPGIKDIQLRIFREFGSKKNKQEEATARYFR